MVAAPKYLARHKAPRTPDELAAHDVIQFTALSSTPEWRFSQDGRDDKIAFKPRYVTNSADAAIGHAVLGGGLTMALSYQVADAIRAKQLRILLAEFEPPPLPIQIVYPTTRLLSAKVRSFIELITATCMWRFIDL